jgi:hypothetical protein
VELGDILDHQTKAILARAQLLTKDLATTRRLILLDAAASSRVDGYPTSASGAGNGGGSAELTSVERAANALGFAGTGSTADEDRTGRPEVDPIHSLALEALRHRKTLLDTLDRLANIEARWKRLQTIDTAKELGNDNWCAHARSLGLPYDQKWDRHCRSNLKGLWPEERPVCLWVRDFALQWKRLPTKDEMLTYLERSVVRMRTSA